MGYNEHTPSNASSATSVAVVVVVLLAIVGMLVLGGASLFWIRLARMDAAAAEVAAVEQLHRAEAAIRQQAVAAADLGAAPALHYEVRVDREGVMSVDERVMSLDELREGLANVKAETSNAFSLLITADAECPIQHVIPLLTVCEEVGDVDYRIASVTDP